MAPFRFRGYALMLLAMFPLASSADATFFVEMGAARVRADATTTGDPSIPTTPAFRDTVPIFAVGSTVSLGSMPIRFSIFRSGSSDETQFFSEPGVIVVVESTLDTHGAKLLINPSWQLNDSWASDAGIGVIHLRQKVRSVSGIGNHDITSTNAIGALGLSYRHSASLSSRIGIELSSEISMVGVGVEFSF